VFVRKDFKRQISKFKKIEMSKLGLEMRESFENNKVVYDGYVKLNFIVAWRKEQGQVSCFKPVDIFVS